MNERATGIRDALSGSAEALAKSLAVCAVLAYGLGIVVQNMHLVRLGITDFNAIRIRSIFTGIWCWIVTFCASLPIIILWIQVKVEEKGKQGNPRRLFLKRLGVTVAFTVLSFGMLRLVFGIFGFHEFTSVWTPLLHGDSHLLRLSVGGGSSALLLSIFSYPLRDTKTHIVVGDAQRLRESTPLVIILFLLVAVNELGFLYPLIDSNFGGGRPEQVLLVLTADGKSTWHRLHKDFHDEDDPFPLLLYETDSSLVLRDEVVPCGSKINPVIVLDKRQVSAYVPTPSPSDSCEK